MAKEFPGVVGPVSPRCARPCLAAFGGGPFRAVVAVTRGGLVPAAVVARELGIRVIETVCVASYDYDKQGEIAVLKPISEEISGSDGGAGVLIVDDLVDTGATARVVREMLPKAHFATVYAKPAGRPLVDSFITEVSQDTWIYLPWDMGLHSPRRSVQNLQPDLWTSLWQRRGRADFRPKVPDVRGNSWTRLISLLPKRSRISPGSGPKTLELHQRAARVMPGGNTRTVLFTSPFPIRVERAEGGHITDVDGHTYLDLLGEFSAGIYGHSHPRIRTAIQEALQIGLNLGSHGMAEIRLAEIVTSRFSMDLVRFTNSGTRPT